MSYINEGNLDSTNLFFFPVLFFILTKLSEGFPIIFEAICFSDFQGFLYMCFYISFALSGRISCLSLPSQVCPSPSSFGLTQLILTGYV